MTARPASAVAARKYSSTKLRTALVRPTLWSAASISHTSWLRSWRSRWQISCSASQNSGSRRMLVCLPWPAMTLRVTNRLPVTTEAYTAIAPVARASARMRHTDATPIPRSAAMVPRVRPAFASRSTSAALARAVGARPLYLPSAAAAQVHIYTEAERPGASSARISCGSDTQASGSREA